MLLVFNSGQARYELIPIFNYLRNPKSVQPEIINTYMFSIFPHFVSFQKQVTGKANILEDKRQRTKNHPKELHLSRTEKMIPVRDISKTSTFSQSFGGFPSTETSHI